ncbi:MAG: ABC transporter substrate-binding protein [Lachnospirales bacterium]
MKNTKKIFALSMGVLLLTTACSSGTGSTDDTSEGSTDTTSSDEQVKLTYALWDAKQAPIYEELIKQFEAENPNVTVEMQITSWKDYWTKLETSINGGNTPDIFWLNIPRSKEYIVNDIILPLDDLGLDLSKYPATHVDAYTYEGQIFGIPKDYDTIAMIYNKTLFEENGVPLPTDDWTWEDVRSAAEAISDPEAGVYGIVAPPEWQGGYYETIIQNGSYPFTEDGMSQFNDPAVVEAMEYWYSFAADGLSPSGADLSVTGGAEYVNSGRAGMFPDGSWSMTTFFEQSEYGKENLDVALLPSGTQNGTTSNSIAHVVGSSCEHPDVAKALVAFLSSKESNDFVGESGVTIPAYEGSDAKIAEAYPDKNIAAFLDSVDFAVHLPNFENFSEAQAVEVEYLTKAWNGEMTIKEACALIEEKSNEILAK